MKITVNNLKKLVKRIVRPDENSGKEKDTFEAALKRARDEAKYNLTEELREKYADFLDSPIKEKCILYEAFGGRSACRKMKLRTTSAILCLVLYFLAS